MSAFAPMNLFGSPDQKRQLLDKLMEQYQQHAARAAALGGSQSNTYGGAFASAGLPNSRPFGGAGLLTAVAPNFAPTLIARLGPGGAGHPIPGVESSRSLGAAVQMPVAAHPHGGSPLDNGPGPGGGASHPAIPVAPGPGAPAAPASASVNSPPPLPTPNGSIPLGNGVIYHPQLGFFSMPGTTAKAL